MKVTILAEEGHDIALRGMAYSYKDRAIDPDAWWEKQIDRALIRAPKLTPLGAGHNKFLRQIMLWVDIEAPRAFWSEFDTYKVGTVAQSESTMHTLAKRGPLPEDFEDGIHHRVFDAFVSVWQECKGDITTLKENLPEGYLQRRIVTMNYQTVRAMIEQRTGHRYKRWGQFLDQLTAQLGHPEYIRDMWPTPTKEK